MTQKSFLFPFLDILSIQKAALFENWNKSTIEIQHMF